MVTPGVYDIVIPRRATFRQRFQLPFDCSEHQLYAQVWETVRRTKKLLDFTIEWASQPSGDFYLVASSGDTNVVTKNGYWDLLVVYPNGESDYWVRGQAILSSGYTENPENV